jgi:hypothetical protein
LFEKSLGSHTLKSIDHGFFPQEVVLVSVLEAALSPRRELFIYSFRPALKTSMLKRKKNSLFEAKLGYQVVLIVSYLAKSYSVLTKANQRTKEVLWSLKPCLVSIELRASV